LVMFVCVGHPRASDGAPHNNVSHYCMVIRLMSAVVQEISPACVPHLALPSPDLGHLLAWQRKIFEANGQLRGRYHVVIALVYDAYPYLDRSPGSNLFKLFLASVKAAQGGWPIR